jgi:hypothetical protein
LSAITAWLTWFHRGAVKMTQPTLIAFLDAREGRPKVYLRTLLYSTARRGHVVESMFLRLRRGESHQNFNIWVYGEERLARGSGIYVGHEGVTFNHHFLPPNDGTPFRFLAGDYELEIHASLVSRSSALLLSRVRLHLSEQQATALEDQQCAVFFDWGPDSSKYHAHVDRKVPKLDRSDPDVQALLKMAD